MDYLNFIPQQSINSQGFLFWRAERVLGFNNLPVTVLGALCLSAQFYHNPLLFVSEICVKCCSLSQSWEAGCFQHYRGYNQYLFAFFTIVSLICCFLMCEFDHNTGLIRCNFSVCSQRVLLLGFQTFYIFYILAFMFSLNEVIPVVIKKCMHSPGSNYWRCEFVSKKKIQAVIFFLNLPKVISVSSRFITALINGIFRVFPKHFWWSCGVPLTKRVY